MDPALRRLEFYIELLYFLPMIERSPVYFTFLFLIKMSTFAHFH